MGDVIPLPRRRLGAAGYVRVCIDTAVRHLDGETAYSPASARQAVREAIREASDSCAKYVREALTYVERYIDGGQFTEAIDALRAIDDHLAGAARREK